MKQEIRNTVGKLVGYIITEGSGNAAAFDARNLKLGTYEASENKTRDRNTPGDRQAYRLSPNTAHAQRTLRFSRVVRRWRSHGNDDDVWQSLLREWLVQHYRKGAARNIPC